MWGHLHPTAGFRSGWLPTFPNSGTLHAEGSTVDGTKSASQSLAQAEILRALARVFPDPLVELARIARTYSASPFDPPLDQQLDAWAKNWQLQELREVAELHVYHWAGTPAAADALCLVFPPVTLPTELPGPRPSTVIDGETVISGQWLEPIEPDWAPPVVWLDSSRPPELLRAHPDYESRDAYLLRQTAATIAYYDSQAATLGYTPAHRRRTFAQDADWYVLKVVARRTYAEMSADPELFGAKGGEIDTIKKGIRRFRKLLHAGK